MKRSERAAFKEAVRDATPIEDVCAEHNITLAGDGGGLLRASCPLHQDATPSFTIYTDDQHFHCYGCAAHGDVFDLVQHLEGVSFPEALSSLAARAGIAPPGVSPEEIARCEQLVVERRRVEDIWGMAADHWHKALTEDARQRCFRENYGFTDETIDKLVLGFADGRVCEALHEVGVTQGELLAAGLGIVVGGRFRDRWRGRLTFPYWRGGRVVYLIAHHGCMSPNCGHGLPAPALGLVSCRMP